MNNNYEKRLKLEYSELKERIKKLENFLISLENGDLPFTPKCPKDIYDVQLDAMYRYLIALEARMILEDIKF